MLQIVHGQDWEVLPAYMHETVSHPYVTVSHSCCIINLLALPSFSQAIHTVTSSMPRIVKSVKKRGDISLV